MATSLYDLSVASYLQTVDAVGGFLVKGLDHCQGCGADPAKFVEGRLAEDMLPLRSRSCLWRTIRSAPSRA